MSTEKYTSSIQLDNLINEKLKNSDFIYESHKMSADQLKSEINTLRYLLYLANQDRIVISIQYLRSQLFARPSLGQSMSSKDSIQKSLSKDLEDLNYLNLYENTGNASDINTVINTSILPNSCENTEREFSPFSPSPVSSPRQVFNEEYVTTGLLSTEVTGIKQRCKYEVVKKELEQDLLQEKSEDSSMDSEKPEDVAGLNCSNYLMQLQGDDDELPCIFSELHSRENSIS